MTRLEILQNYTPVQLKDTWKNEEGIEAESADDKDRIADLEKELKKLKK